MDSFSKGFACGAVAATALAAGLAVAQGMMFPVTNGSSVGVVRTNVPFGVGCVDANGQLDPERRAVVARPQGREATPDVYVVCQPMPRRIPR